MNIYNKRTGIMILIAVLWAVITVLGWTNHYLIGMLLGVLLMVLHMLLGVAKKDMVAGGLVLYPIVIWALLWGISFILSWHFSKVYAGTMPDFMILGFHPSFAWTVITYWLGGVATITIGFVVIKDKWLSQKDWDDFTEKIVNLNKEASK